MIFVKIKKFQELNEKSEDKSDVMLTLYAYLMDTFFVPYKAVVLRLYEIGVYHDVVVNTLLNESSNDKSNMVKQVTDRIWTYSKQPNSRLNQITNSRSLKGLAELLELAESKETLPDAAIQKLRKDFDIERLTQEEFSDEELRETWKNLVNLSL